MPAKDWFHEVVKNALKKDGWEITHDPFYMTFGKRDLFVDLGAELPIAAKKGEVKIAVEIKSFVGQSDMNDLKNAMGTFAIYKSILKRTEPNRKLYLAIEQQTYDGIFNEEIGDVIMKDYDVSLLVFDETNEEIKQWIE